MVQLTNNHFSVEVPDDAQNFEFEIEARENWYRLNYLIQINDVESGFYGEWEQLYIDLPPGSWQFLFTTKEATEEDAHKIVESVITANEQPVYWDYEFSMWTRTSVGSLQSLLKAKGCDVNKNWAIIQKL